MGLVFWVTIVGDSLRMTQFAFPCLDASTERVAHAAINFLSREWVGHGRPSVRGKWVKVQLHTAVTTIFVRSRGSPKRHNLGMEGVHTIENM